jgi:hypothetical protein
LADELSDLRSESAQLRARLDQLDQRVQALAAQRGSAAAAAPRPEDQGGAQRLAPLSEPQPASARALTPTPVPSRAAVDAAVQELALRTQARKAWTGIHRESLQADVEQQLGHPQSVLRVGNRTGWVYRYPGGATGSVFFDLDAKVVSFQAPSL